MSTHMQTETVKWANGAFLYLLPKHAKVIQRVVEEQGVFLQSKHILVSPTFVDALDLCLHAKPERSGREAFLVSRAGVVQSETRLLLLPFRDYVYSKLEPPVVEEKDPEKPKEEFDNEKRRRWKCY